MTEKEEMPKKNDANHASKLPPEIVGRFLQNLSVMDRLKSERVSPRWKRVLEKWGWTKQTTLDWDIVFEGANEGEIARFWETLDDNGNCQNRLDLYGFTLPTEKPGTFAPIGQQLRALEELNLWNCRSLDGESRGAIAEGCQRLRSLRLNLHRLTERELFQLAKMPKLTVLKVLDLNGAFSDAVLKGIAALEQLKKLTLTGDQSKPDESTLTDASIVYLVQRCKSLVSLSLYGYPGITERSVEAVVAEVWRRNGTPPRALPTDPRDPEIFYMDISRTGIDLDRAREFGGPNPWLRLGSEDPRKII